MKNKLTFLGLIAFCVISINAIMPILFKGQLDIGTLHNYEDTYVPDYIFNEEVFGEDITDELATLGRVLFYDKSLSQNFKVSCASCHKQEFAFGDTLVASPGFDDKLTERHSTRLMNLNYNHMPEVFWDMRAGTLDSLPLMVLTNAIEMGFSGQDGQPPIGDLVIRLKAIDYYEALFDLAYGDPIVTEERINLALTQFVRSIESYDSRYDLGRTMVDSARMDFPNFTALENRGKDLFFSPFGDPLTIPIRESSFDFNGSSTRRILHPEWATLVDGKMGCADCHGIDNFTSRETSLTGNNGIVGVIDHPSERDTSVKRSPSLRNLFNLQSVEVGPYMHDGSLLTLDEVLDHYATIGLPGEKVLGLHSSLDIDAPNGSTYVPPPSGANGPSGASGPTGPGGWGGWGGQSGGVRTIIREVPPRLDDSDKEAMIAFMKTLSGQAIFEAEKWSDPFDEDGNIAILDECESLPMREMNVNICEGDIYDGYYASGQYTKRVRNIAGCDSLLRINLTVDEMPRKQIDTTLCLGESFMGYEDDELTTLFLENSASCDTMLTLNIKVQKPYNEYRNSLFKEICVGKDSERYERSGNYTDTLLSKSLGCDSIYVSYYVRLLQPPVHEVFQEICEDESYLGVSEDGIHELTFRNEEGCDSIVMLNLEILKTPYTSVYKEICEGEAFEGHTLSGWHSDSFIGSNGCDSIRSLRLKVFPKTESLFTREICEGDEYEGYRTAGFFEDHFINKYGCDSTRYIDLKILKHTDSYSEKAICRGENYEGYLQEGSYTDVLVNAEGCDSTRVIDLIILDHTESYYEREICDGESFEGYNNTGSYTDVLTNVEGCDSTRHIVLTMLAHSDSYYDMAICAGEAFEGYDDDGYYIDVLTNHEGCDSTRVIQLEILNHSDSYEKVHLCPGEDFEGYTQGAHQELYTNAVGCDSLRYIEIVNISSQDAICTETSSDEVNKFEESDYLRIGPNPVYEQLFVRIDKPERIPAELTILSIEQRPIYSQDITTSETIVDMSNFESGVYLFLLKSEENIFLQQIIKI